MDLAILNDRTFDQGFNGVTILTPVDNRGIVPDAKWTNPYSGREDTLKASLYAVCRKICPDSDSANLAANSASAWVTEKTIACLGDGVVKQALYPTQYPLPEILIFQNDVNKIAVLTHVANMSDAKVILETIDGLFKQLIEGGLTDVRLPALRAPSGC